VSPEEVAEPAPARPGRRSNVTTRAIALVVVLLVLVISYASSLRIYFTQAHEISATRAEIADRTQRISSLQSELAKWDDPDYVRTQARQQLGWVVPGETGYQVVGADGQPLGGGAAIEDGTDPAATKQDVWWAKLWGSVQAADQPAPAKKKAKDVGPITAKTKPNGSR
jgi:cell division protein FtsB